ncbi:MULTISPECIES: AbrB/MazE/SpoVT family DNA-binding domain-containing protein [Kocuria]|uniref:AbrB/MazE/SpoVT family DNA-binding domain-containing protein n=1 Tax=Kocuria subflava TaxID=1736139 RepID=A0A846U8B4_9MICC|nr:MULTISPECIES: AbrB/MazE/SpoVT family DNA-binding domain-containing protein [Kocuria]NKE09826.1 AbrB/MazE/SpoVT family DNA-binding domain-containing protein [Kocuria subflava]
MATGTMTSKGQITIPKDIRASLGLTPGTRVTFTRNHAGEIVMSRASGSLMDLGGTLHRPGEPVSIDVMEEAIIQGANQ